MLFPLPERPLIRQTFPLSRSISVLKILGYKSNEISGLYNFSTGAVVLISMAVSIPLLGLLMKYLYFWNNIKI